MPRRLSYEEFRDAYNNHGYWQVGRPFLSGRWFRRARTAIRNRAWYTLAFYCRIRTGDRDGFFGKEAKGAKWCWPWQWMRLYYAARYPQEGQS